MRTFSSMLMVAGFAAWLASPQDPPSKRPPPQQVEAGSGAAAKSPPAQKPGVPRRHRWQGVYKLRSRTVRGQLDPRPNRGYLAITGKYALLHLASPGLTEEQPLLHSAVRTWRQVEDSMQMTSTLEFLTEGTGDIHLVTPGTQESRRVMEVRGGLRVYSGLQSWLEFERVE